MPDRSNVNVAGSLAVLAAAALWGDFRDLCQADRNQQGCLTLCSGLLARSVHLYRTAGCSSFTTWVYAFGFSAPVLFPFQFATKQPWPVSPVVCLWFAGLVILSTAIPFPIYAFGLGRLPASVATILAMTEVPIVSVYAYFLLGERMSSDQILGAVLVVIGVLLLSWRRRSNH